MKLLRISILSVLSILFLISSENVFSKKGVEKTVVAEIGKEKVTYQELADAYKKNMNRTETSLHKLEMDSILSFVELYSDYRLKVLDALDRGFEKDSSVKEEIMQNRRMLAESYFYDKKLIEPNVNEMLSRRSRELQIAIIVKTFPVDKGSGFDTLETWKVSRKILEELLAGADFATMAKDSSDDPETAKNGGLVVNYITSGRTQRPIDTVIFKMKPGEIYKELIRINDGYLIIKLVKNEPRQYVKTSHILLSDGIVEDSAAVIEKADSLISLLRKGADFVTLAEENSDDPASAVRGGSMGDWYSRSSGFLSNGRSLLPNFEDKLFEMKVGEISDKVFTEYGIHIIKKDSVRDINMEAEREELKSLYRRVYYETDKKEFLLKTKEDLNFKIHYDVIADIVAVLDSTKTTMQQDWNKGITDDLNAKTLYEIAGKSYRVNEFLLDLNKKREYRGTATNTNGLIGAVEKMTEPIAFDKATENLEKEYPEFAELIKEFKDGILLFKVAAIEVWDKLKFDSAAAYKFWEPKKGNYRTFVQYDLTEVYVLSDTVANDIYKFAKEGTSFESLAEQYTQRKDYREKKGNWGVVSTRDNELAKLVLNANPKEGDIIGPVTFEQGYSVVKVNKVIPQRDKTFEEAIPDFAPAYQEMMQKKLESEWLAGVRKKFPVKVHNKELKKVVSEMTNK